MPIRSARFSLHASALVAALWFMASPTDASAQEAAVADEPGYQARIGDAWLDRHLADINLYAARYPMSFSDEMSRYYAVPRAYVDALLQQPGWEAGDVFMACALAQRVGQPCRALVRQWSRDHADGWEGVAQRVEVEPGSAGFRQLRDDVEASYTRWARPLLPRR